MSDRQVPSGPILPAWWILLRDIGLFALGVVIALQEVQRPEIRDSALLFAGSLLGGPVFAAAWTSGVDALRSRAGIGGPSSSSPEAPPASSVSPSSSGP